MLKQIYLAPLLLLTAACASKSIDLTILHTNDHHGHYWRDSKGQIGMAARSTVLQKVRKDIYAKGGHSLLLSGGDINTGTMESDIYDAEPDFKGMKKLGYDAMAVGNHEFDNSLDILFNQNKIAGFPFLSANTRWKSGPRKGERVFTNPLYIVREYNGIKVGVFGLTTKDTSIKASHDDSRKLVYFTPIIPEAKEVVARMKKEGVDFIIATTHVGHNGSNTANGDVALAQAVDGIDVIVGGHSQEIIKAQKVNNTIIVQAHEWGKYLGHLNLQVSKNSFGGISKKLQSPYSLIPINLKDKVVDAQGNKSYVYRTEKIEEDPELLKMLSPYYDNAQKKAQIIIGRSSGDFGSNNNNIRKEQTALGQLVAMAMQAKGKADIGITNGGGIRGNIEKGPITYRKLYEIHPYGNTIATIKLTPKELFDFIALNVDLFFRKKGKVYKDLSGGYPQMAGLKLYLKDEKLHKLTSFSNYNYWEIEKIGDEIIHRGKDRFVVALSSFSAKGGDGLPDFSGQSIFEDTGYTIDNALIEYLQNTLDTMKNPIRPEVYAIRAKAIIN